MKLSGKILHYSPEKGAGIIITKERQKFPFAITAWDDYDVLPKAGLEVVFDLIDLQPHNIIRQSAGTTYAMLTSEEETAEAAEDVMPNILEAPSQISLTVTVSKAIQEYFEQIEHDIAEHSNTKQVKGQLEFLKIRRFLFTMFNNLSELDTHFITPKIKRIRDDLLQMSKVYDDYRVKTTYPDVAYDKVFLSRQNDYVRIRHDTQLIVSELQRYRMSEEFLEQTIEEKEQAVARTPRASTRFARMDEELKEIRSNYVDVVHMIASLEEQHKINARMMSEFEKEHRQEFLNLFNEASRQYRDRILYILNVQSYQFDAEIWAQAKQSKVIKNFFHESHIEGDYCAKTYLKYYLNTLDKDKISAEQKELFDLYDYLESLEHDTIAIVVNDVDVALRVKSLLSRLDAPVVFESFIDERKALTWATENRANILIIEERLSNTTARQFIREYKKKVSLHPKIVLLSKVDPASAEQRLYDKVIDKEAPSSELYAAIKEVILKE